MRAHKSRRAWSAAAALAAGTLLGGMAMTHAADDDTPAPAGREGRLVKPWSDLDDLTSEQVRDIRLIRGEILDKMADLRREERFRILTVLNESQREAIDRIERDARDAARDRDRVRRQAARDAAVAGDGDAGGDE